MNSYTNPPVVPPQRENRKIGASESTYPALDPKGNEAMEYPAELPTREHIAKAGPALGILRGISTEQFHAEIKGKSFWHRFALT